MNVHRNSALQFSSTSCSPRMCMLRTSMCVRLSCATAQLSFLPALFKPKLHGAAYGKGIYLSPISSISFGYSGRIGSLFNNKPLMVSHCPRPITFTKSVPHTTCLPSWNVFTSGSFLCPHLCAVLCSSWALGHRLSLSTALPSFLL